MNECGQVGDGLTTYMVNYDLRAPGKNYDDLINI